MTIIAKERERKGMQLRRFYMVITIILICIIIPLRFIFLEYGMEDFRPDNWGEMSFAVGAAVLTLVGIISSVVISGENERRNGFLDDSTFVLQELERKALSNPDRTLNEVYDNSINKLRATINERQPIKYLEFSIIGFFSFFSFARALVSYGSSLLPKEGNSRVSEDAVSYLVLIVP